MPQNQLNPKVKNVWRISDAIWITLVWLSCALPFLVVGALEFEDGGWVWTVAGFITGHYIVAMIVFLAVLPPIRYVRWRYEVGENHLEIAKGIIWRKRYMIPFVRVQSTDTKQGPILRAFGLASVTAATAAGEHSIPGLQIDEADCLRDRIAEQARLAQEDV
jgi:membrane protein YdbS with pleckstrin-like domain